MADVFVSYKTESTLDLVENAVVPAIESAGFSCWYAGRDMKPDDFGGAINRAIRKCRVFLRILDKAGTNSQHIMNETVLAIRRLTNYEDIALFSFRTDGCDIHDYGLLEYYLNCQQIIDGCPPDKEHIQVQELVQRIARIVRKKRPKAESRVSQHI